MIDHTKNDSEEIVNLNVPVVSIRNVIDDKGVAMEEDVGQDDTLRDKNITVAALGGSSSSSDVDIRKNLESLLLGSMQLTRKEIRKVVEMIIIKSREKKVQKMSKEELIHEAESMVENEKIGHVGYISGPEDHKPYQGTLGTLEVILIWSRTRLGHSMDPTGPLSWTLFSSIFDSLLM